VEVKLKCRIVRFQSGFSQDLAPAVFTGATRDISRGGIFIEWDNAGSSGYPAVGDFLRIDVELPSGTPPQRCLYCEGILVRAVPSGSGAWAGGIAVERMEFRQSAGGAMPLADSEVPEQLLM
jgi:hypothetical protein